MTKSADVHYGLVICAFLLGSALAIPTLMYFSSRGREVVYTGDFIPRPEVEQTFKAWREQDTKPVHSEEYSRGYVQGYLDALQRRAPN